MALRQTGANGQNRIQKQHALFRPRLQIAVTWRWNVQIVLDFFKNIEKRRRRFHPLLDRKTQAVRLTGTVIWILAQNHHAHVFKRSKPKSVENIRTWRINDMFLFLSEQNARNCRMYGCSKVSPSTRNHDGSRLGTRSLMRFSAVCYLVESASSVAACSAPMSDAFGSSTAAIGIPRIMSA